MQLALITLSAASLCQALPWPLAAKRDDSCSTTTVQVIIPTTTVTYTTTPISTIYASTAEDLGTWTSTVRIPVTSTIATVTSTETTCASSAPDARSALFREHAFHRPAGPEHPPGRFHPARQADTTEACVVTATSTTSVGQTYVFVPGTSTKLYTQYTQFTQATVTVTAYTGTSYVVASASATVTPAAEACGGASTTSAIDTRCSSAAMVSAAGGTGNAQYGLQYKSDVPTSGASYSTVTDDAATCCQMCAEQSEICSGSAWDVRTGACTLEFAVDPTNGQLNCGESLLAYYDAGPNSPMAPGTGLWVANMCGKAGYGSAKPDDGT